MTIYYVYVYLRKDGSPYYIGKGKGARAVSQQHSVNLPIDSSRIIFLETNLTEIGAFALERRYILWYGRKDLDTGILRNLTDGGEGSTGPKSKIHCIAIKRALTGKPKSIAHRANIKKNHHNCIGSNNPAAKIWEIISPAGEKFIITNGLKSWCKLNKLPFDTIRRMALEKYQPAPWSKCIGYACKLIS